MAAETTPKSRLTSSFENAFQEIKKNISKNFQAFGKKFESIKNSTIKAISETASKIQKFINNNYVNVFFAILSISALWHAPYRFLFAATLGLAIQKVNHKSQSVIVTNTSLALNILAALGIILEKTICPVCDPTYYLAPCISGIASAEAAYNLYQSFNKTASISTN
ncbi:MAG: hypothetical protein K1060chlam1_00325 [Candidatus Anoxychlamydiales bacterium]|nr:hypothetical protein [Candidatus Anoxychlamydiales bacterium]